VKRTRRILIILHPGALALDAAGPAEVFGSANRFGSGDLPRYELLFASAEGGSIRTASNLRVETDALSTIDPETIDTILVVGGIEVGRNPLLVDWLKQAARLVRRTCGICTGAFLLAEAGLLDGRRAVTHWSEVERLQAVCPSARVELDPIYLVDGPIWTSAGVTAGIDLALALVQADHGREAALAVARNLVVFMQRPGGQAQFSRVLAAQSQSGRLDPQGRMTELDSWMSDNLSGDLSVPRLAERAGMAERTFVRHFIRRYKRSPAEHVEALRIEAACARLADRSASLKETAHVSGFGNEERMRRAFLRRFGVSPGTYRERFLA